MRTFMLIASGGLILSGLALLIANAFYGRKAFTAAVQMVCLAANVCNFVYWWSAAQ